MNKNDIHVYGIDPGWMGQSGVSKCMSCKGGDLFGALMVGFLSQWIMIRMISRFTISIMVCRCLCVEGKVRNRWGHGWRTGWCVLGLLHGC